MIVTITIIIITLVTNICIHVYTYKTHIVSTSPSASSYALSPY